MTLDQFIQNQGAQALSWHQWIAKAQEILRKQDEALEKLHEAFDLQSGVLGELPCDISDLLGDDASKYEEAWDSCCALEADIEAILEGPSDRV